jgi:hypothetical protein
MVSDPTCRPDSRAGLLVLLRQLRPSTRTTAYRDKNRADWFGFETHRVCPPRGRSRNRPRKTHPLTAMTFRGFKIRVVLVATFTWVVGAIVDSFGWALYWALLLLFLYEVLRPRRWAR